MATNTFSNHSLRRWMFGTPSPYRSCACPIRTHRNKCTGRVWWSQIKTRTTCSWPLNRLASWNSGALISWSGSAVVPRWSKLTWSWKNPTIQTQFSCKNHRCSLCASIFRIRNWDRLMSRSWHCSPMLTVNTKSGSKSDSAARTLESWSGPAIIL